MEDLLNYIGQYFGGNRDMPDYKNYRNFELKAKRLREKIEREREAAEKLRQIKLGKAVICAAATHAILKSPKALASLRQKTYDVGEDF